MKEDVIKEKYHSDYLMSDLGKFRKQLSHQSVNIDKVYRQILQERFSHGTKLGKEIYINFVNDDTIESLDYLGIPCYNINNEKIKLNSKADIINERGSGTTWFHEHGHLIDFNLGIISDDAMYKYLLLDDVFHYRMYYGCMHHLDSMDEVNVVISNELNDMHLHSAVSDLMEGLTDGEIVNCAGHGLNYWVHDKKTITSEAFAHMFECQFDKERYKEMKKYFPKSLDYFERN
ncbi:MAG: hypothetical protein LUG46_08400 [Erysipelotrichaceae bacterium]|nr:hypothetical protein [Erysipelotrichaceae bacterium]